MRYKNSYTFYKIWCKERENWKIEIQFKKSNCGKQNKKNNKQTTKTKKKRKKEKRNLIEEIKL